MCTITRNTALCFFLVVLFSTSCVTQRKVEYLQDKSDGKVEFQEALFLDYKLKSNDELYIQINSLDEASAVFPNFNQQNYAAVQPYGASLLSYSIDSEGYLLLPIIGRIPVRDKTLTEVSVMLKDSLDNVLNQPVVIVKLVNKYVSVLGEVRNPGHFSYAQDKLTVFDALGLAGDITEYGDRNNVILIRNDHGVNYRISVDITNADLLSAESYNMRPNDILYVKPLRQKFWGLRQFPFAVILSAITTGLLVYNVFGY